MRWLDAAQQYTSNCTTTTCPVRCASLSLRCSSAQPSTHCCCVHVCLPAEWQTDNLAPPPTLIIAFPDASSIPSLLSMLQEKHYKGWVKDPSIFVLMYGRQNNYTQLHIFPCTYYYSMRSSHAYYTWATTLHNHPTNIIFSPTWSSKPMSWNHAAILLTNLML